MPRFRSGVPVCPAPADPLSLRGMTGTWLNRQIIRLGPKHRPVKTGHWPSISRFSVPQITSPSHHEYTRDKSVQGKMHIPISSPHINATTARHPPSPMLLANTTLFQTGNRHQYPHSETQTNPSAHTHTTYQVPSSKPRFVTVVDFSWLPPPLATRGETCENAAKIVVFQRLQGPVTRHNPMPDGACNVRADWQSQSDGSQESDLDDETRILQTLQKLTIETNTQDTNNCHLSRLPRS